MADVTLAQFKQFLSRKLSDEDFGSAIAMLRDVLAGGAAEDEETGLPRPGGAMDQRHRFAMDSASPGKIVAERELAIQECSLSVPRESLIACDSAENVFRTALRQMGVPSDNLHPSALPAMFRTVRRGGSPTQHLSNPRAAADFATRFPDAARIRNAG
jgi:hypothetical protein